MTDESPKLPRSGWQKPEDLKDAVDDARKRIDPNAPPVGTAPDPDMVPVYGGPPPSVRTVYGMPMPRRALDTPKLWRVPLVVVVVVVAAAVLWYLS